jgi:hypothetical protein
MSHKKVRAAIAEYLKNHPELSYKEVALKLNCATSTVATIARQHGITRQRRALSDADLKGLGE